jgi:lipoprotein-anchoring transpeptidase ErfK/SrfK
MRDRIRRHMLRSCHVFAQSLTFVSLVAILAVGTIAPLTVIAAPEPAAPAVPVKLSQTQQAIARLKRSPDRWIEVNLTTQRVIAWEGKRWVDAMIVSTGKSATPTVTGVFAIYDRYREARMQGDDYDIPDVPYVMYFSGGYGFHGAYWHNRFGTPVSHGCVNLAVDKAKWLYEFAAIGTPVVVHY